jgi:hypothetical protein
MPEQRHRRSIYSLYIRGLSDPFMEVFNQPGPDTSCERRDASTVTPQVFSLFNSQISYERALAMAGRPLKETSTKLDAVERAFELAYGRRAAGEEIQKGLQHWNDMAARHQNLTFEAPSYPREIIRQAIEEMNGEPFQFTERLEVYDDFVQAAPSRT